MTPTDAFTTQIIQLVRRMPDDAILALVKDQLASVKGISQSLASVAKARPGRPVGSKNLPKLSLAAAIAAAPKDAAPRGKPGRKPGRKKPGPKPKGHKAAKKAVAKKTGPKPGAKKGAKRGRRAGAGRSETLSLVERVVKAGHGVAASDVAKAASIPQSRASAALKELKLAKRIYQGGDRRFARYAGDAKSAEAASLAARKNAGGPKGQKKKKK